MVVVVVVMVAARNVNGDDGCASLRIALGIAGWDVKFRTCMIESLPVESVRLRAPPRQWTHYLAQCVSVYLSNQVLDSPANGIDFCVLFKQILLDRAFF